MKFSQIKKPKQDEHSEYFNRYIDLVPDENILELMQNQILETMKFFEQINEDKSNYSYAEGKWSIKEVLGHLIDTEIIFGTRALRIARNDKTHLPGFDENEFTANANFNSLSFTNLLELFILIRKSTIGLFKTFSDDMWIRRGTVDNKILSVRSVPYIVFGHVI